ncbi:MAG: hypothetical protein J2P36_15590 [Ktedonobacteraceae bacterium]|nr:hypothetical protein [Ktedonobacteraceae bacterium]
MIASSRQVAIMRGNWAFSYHAEKHSLSINGRQIYLSQLQFLIFLCFLRALEPSQATIQVGKGIILASITVDDLASVIGAADSHMRSCYIYRLNKKLLVVRLSIRLSREKGIYLLYGDL